MAQDKTFQMRVDGEWLDMIDDWRLSGGHEISRADAVRYLVALGMKAGLDDEKEKELREQPSFDIAHVQVYDAPKIELPGHIDRRIRELRNEIVHGKYASDLANAVFLTEREHQVLGLVSERKTNREVAEHLGLSEHTVKVHLHSVMQKLKVNKREKAAEIFRHSEEVGGAETPPRK